MSTKRGELSNNVENFVSILTPYFQPNIFSVGSINKVPIWRKESCFDNIISMSAQKVHRKHVPSTKYTQWQWSAILCYCRCSPFEEQRGELFCRVNRPAHSSFHNTQQLEWMQTHSSLPQYIHFIKIRYANFSGHEFLFHPSNFVAQ